MWEKAPIKKDASKTTRFFLDWIEDELFCGEIKRQAKDVLHVVEEMFDDIKRYRQTPQSAPWHTEGPVLSYHIERILCGIFAITGGANLLGIEDLARERSLRGEFIELQHTIQEKAGLLIVYALTHDIAKPEVLSFSAPGGSIGEKEGFSVYSRRERKTADNDEKQHYLKLLRSFEVDRENQRKDRVMASFFDAYEIRAHNYMHARNGASEKFQGVRETLGKQYHLSADDQAILPFLIKNHIDVLTFFKESASISKYHVLSERANAAGFDADDALDLLLAAAFLDVSIGSLHYQHGQFTVDITSMLNFLRAEQDANPQRREKRKARIKENTHKMFRAILVEAGLHGESVFALLHTPFGPERAEVVRKIEEYVRDSNLNVEFGTHTKEMRKRIRKAQDLLTARTDT